jgi:copper homeostasis protein
MALVEICVQGLASALAAGRGGADRVELCEHLEAGGVTPSAGAIEVACRRLGIPVHVLIRPRGGDFVYNEDEREAMRRDIQAARSAGAAGIVLGALRRDGTVDRELCAELIAAARPLSVTFHQAFDATRSLAEALDVLIELGVDRVLTSGGAARAIDGLARLVELQRRAESRLVILPGGGIAVPEIDAFIDAGLGELHLGFAATLGDRGVTDAGAVRRIIDRVAEATARCPGRGAAPNSGQNSRV